MKIHIGSKTETSRNTCYINLEKLFPRFKKFTLLEQAVVEVGVRHLLITLVSGYKTDKIRKIYEVYHELCKLTKKEKLVLISTIKNI